MTIVGGGQLGVKGKRETLALALAGDLEEQSLSICLFPTSTQHPAYKIQDTYNNITRLEGLVKKMTAKTGGSRQVPARAPVRLIKFPIMSLMDASRHNLGGISDSAQKKNNDMHHHHHPINIDITFTLNVTIASKLPSISPFYYLPHNVDGEMV